jgi:hypothetical protein
MTLLLRAMIALALAIVATTPSEARYACAVKATSDGYVALRKGPSARHPEVGKMKPQEFVGLLHPPSYESIVRKGDWLFVRWSPGTRRTADHVPEVDESKQITGWVRDKLVDCFDE